MSTVLKTENLKKVYGSRGVSYVALQDINIEIEEGEFTGIMGPSGAGKTTLLNIISTIDKPTSGRVVINGTNIINMKEDKLTSFRRDNLGFIFQDFNLLDTMTVKENIILPLALSKVSPKEIDQRLIRISKILGIDNILNKYPWEISGGQKQRTASARAIINNPSLILADEPTGALDSKSSSELLECFTDLNNNNKSTILVVTHDAFAASYCKRILFIKDGQIFTELVRGGTRKEFFHKILDVLSVIGGESNDII
ncbi:ABC transporter ATP-binding protein [Oceanotoga sp. DSM 15011]|jgi:putative ABC transport system ATP-binding protein|uniref:ABC transport system ATP-binding protein n=1 Tax=Oceanotoga teriensis TaxID=515440 RepID=A0AA45C511_9BACT|nr:MULTISPECIES: ABC transporter ATP-binding protein [Oceanotoga]MDN5341949.1 bacitracin transport system ATP-binding protein [Oceanotoga sp.]PWJ87894.1 putative ABC transport system ATP-binding protein [Oceanotoga teriensis]UYO99253.1 ABC transporter ATP-binding protein [Oceanotoga sp. DSM 15011]